MVALLKICDGSFFVPGFDLMVIDNPIAGTNSAGEFTNDAVLHRHFGDGAADLTCGRGSLAKRIWSASTSKSFMSRSSR